jgi:hypothetical protein
VTNDLPLIAVSESELADFCTRLAGTRWPEPWPARAWEAGTDGSGGVRQGLVACGIDCILPELHEKEAR